jgi:hypothetical protein
MKPLSASKHTGADRITTAEQELGSFFNAVKELFGLSALWLSGHHVGCKPVCEWRHNPYHDHRR